MSNFFAEPQRQVRKQANRAILKTTVDAVRTGRIDETQGAHILRTAGFPEHLNVFSNKTAPGIGGVLHSVAKPLGLSRSANIAREKKAISSYQREHPGASAFEAAQHNLIQAGTVLPAGGLVKQALATLAQEAVYNPGGVVAGVTDPVGTGKRLERRVVETVHGEHPADAALLGFALASGGAGLAARGLGATRAVRAGEGARAALTRPGYAGGSLLHAPHPGVATIDLGGGVTVERPLSRNVIARELVQKPRAARIQKKIDKQARSPKTKPGVVVKGTFSPQTTIGRERRAQIRVENAKAAALRVQQQRAIHGLSRGEHAALSVVGIEGEGAFLNPADAIGRHVATHEQFGRLGGDVEAHAARIKDLDEALKVLQKPSAKFRKAVALTQALSRETEQRLIKAGHLLPDTARGRLDTTAQIYGHEQAPAGSFYFPLAKRYTQEPIGATGTGGYQARPGQYGAGPTQVRIPGLHRQFTGESLASADIPVNVAGTITHRSAAVDTLLAAERNYDALWKAGSSARRSSFDIPIRNTREIRDELRNIYRDLETQLAGLAPEQAGFDATRLENLRKMIEAGDAQAAGVGAKVEGVRWIDRRQLANLGETSVSGPFLKAADLITNPVRFATLYARPAYILNLAGNLGMAGITEGVRVFPALRKAVLANRVYGERDTAIIDSLMGASLSRSYAIGTGAGHEINQRFAEIWNDITDLHARRSAFFHEAALAGYRTPTEIHRLLHSDALKGKLAEVTRRGNKNLVDYGSLTPVERNSLRRVIYFYPWVSRATIWTLRTMVEHPWKTYTLSQLGAIGAENAHRKLGTHLAEWADQAGLVPFGRHGDLVSTINPQSINTPATAVEAGRAAIDTAKAVIGLPHGGAVGDVLTPALTLGTQATQAQSAGDRPGGLLGILESLPQVAALKRGGLLGGPSKTYPDQGIGPALGPLAAGGLYPRNINREQLRKSGYKQSTSLRFKLSSDLERARILGLITAQDEREMNEYAKKASKPEVKRALRQIGDYIREAGG